MAEEETLVSRRPKRSTAGNRMELALAELAMEQTQEVEEDLDFVNDKVEEDIFESDFASTDEEAVEETGDAGEMAVQDEERKERKMARARVEKATALAHARQRVTFDPEALTKSKPSAQKPKRRVSLGAVVNAETGEVIEGTTGGATSAKRQSQRRHTVMNTSATANRMKDAEEKKAHIPKKMKAITKAPTQDELIARALDTEEGNIIEHRDYLLLEEEKRARARVVRKSIEGPVLRWISRKEQVKVPVQPIQPVPPPLAGHYGFIYAPGAGPLGSGGASAGTTGTHPYTTPFYFYAPPVAQAAPKVQESSSNTPKDASTSTPQVTQPPTTTSSEAPGPSTSSLPTPTPMSSTSNPHQHATLPYPYITANPNPHPPQERTEDICRNYLVHEISQVTAVKPPWKDTMVALFGDHVKWEELRVYTGKQRPMSVSILSLSLLLRMSLTRNNGIARPIPPCPITGTPAKYIDPRTNVPYANLAAYRTLTKILAHEYVWSEALGCYVTPGPGWTGQPGGDHEQSSTEEETIVPRKRRIGESNG
ncbi:YL1 nuclear protein-domain-containing protein [Phlebopus sp. FC_14]|nr:YL1 nuclear protein-domain-containing protein [Phlebopus sp. FC_14]